MIIRMGRPRKEPGERKDYHLRVPLTDAQHSLIEQAAAMVEQDKAAWARALLLEGAKKLLKARKNEGGKGHSLEKTPE